MRDASSHIPRTSTVVHHLSPPVPRPSPLILRPSCPIFHPPSFVPHLPSSIFHPFIHYPSSRTPHQSSITHHLSSRTPGRSSLTPIQFGPTAREAQTQHRHQTKRTMRRGATQAAKSLEPPPAPPFDLEGTRDAGPPQLGWVYPQQVCTREKLGQFTPLYLRVEIKNDPPSFEQKQQQSRYTCTGKHTHQTEQKTRCKLQRKHTHTHTHHTKHNKGEAETKQKTLQALGMK